MEFSFPLLLFIAKKQQLKTFNDIKGLINQGKTREAKLAVRDNAWPVSATIRSQLWPLLCSQHHKDKAMMDGFYWEMVNQVFGTTELPEKPILLPPFVDSSHCLPYHLTKKGRAVADRVVSVLGFASPEISYSPSLYPITAILLHFMSEEDCFNCVTNLVAAKDKIFITQTKLLYEVIHNVVHLSSKIYTISLSLSIRSLGKR
jgi:hypothetical protein